jgi:hypothetical protein
MWLWGGGYTILWGEQTVFGLVGLSDVHHDL